MRRLSLILAVIMFCAACDGGDELVASDVVSSIPWEDSETTRYRLLQGDDVKGSAELRLFQDAESTRITQNFVIPDEEITDSVDAEVSPDTLRPREVERVIDGPEGKRECQAMYSSSGTSVTIEQQAEEDERIDVLDIPAQHYDTWADLFLWRTLDFAEDVELKYVDVLSCSLAKPDLLSVVLKVKSVEEVTVPAGTFQAWRLEIRSGGRTQRAWYADDERRTLVRYDNGDLVFELESIN